MNEASRVAAEMANATEQSPDKSPETPRELMDKMIEISAEAEAYRIAQLEIDTLIKKLAEAKAGFTQKQSELTQQADQIHKELIAADGADYLERMPGASRAFGKAMAGARVPAKHIVLNKAAESLGFSLNEDNE